MSLTADDGLHVFVDGEDMTDKVEFRALSPGVSSFDVTFPEGITVHNGDTLTLTWTETSGGTASAEVEVLKPLTGHLRVTGTLPDCGISVEDHKIIDDFIIDSVVRGHARRL